MNVKNIVFFALGLFIFSSAQALKIQVMNWSDKDISVDPVWSGSPRGFILLDKDHRVHEYNSHLHHLKGLHVRVGDHCYYYDFESHNLRGTGTIKLFVGDRDVFNKMHVGGYKDMVRKGGTGVNMMVDVSEQGICR